MARFLVQEILSVTSGQLIGSYGEGVEKEVLSDICTDSRTMVQDALFVALIGKKFDGHQYCERAHKLGARFFLLSDESYLPPNAIGIVVDDTLFALQSIAKHYRRRLNCPVLAVTGSVGKTSTRQILETAFSGFLRTHATKGNNNNEIGLPLTILDAPEDTELLILEMGMRLKGEIRELTQIAQPDIAVVTNIGVSHIERLGSQQDILEAKMEICEGLGAQGLLIINGDDPLLRAYVNQPINCTWRHLGMTSFSACNDANRNADYEVHAEKVNLFSDHTNFDVCVHKKSNITKYTCYLRVVGAHHVRNALIAILCAAGLKQDINKVIEALKYYIPIGSRGKIIHTRNFTIYDDAYNASPESMSAAFDSVIQIAQEKRKIAVLGGILELGDYASEVHEEVGKMAGKVDFDAVYLQGDNKEDFKRGILTTSPDTRVYLFEDNESMLNKLLSELQTDDVILIKASNSFRFEAVAEEITKYDQGIIQIEG